MYLLFVQDCDLRYRPTSPCGLQQSSHVTWPKYHKHASSLPPCTMGDQSGKFTMIELSDLSQTAIIFKLIFQAQTIFFDPDSNIIQVIVPHHGEAE